jgi:hypothetical protein
MFFDGVDIGLTVLQQSLDNLIGMGSVTFSYVLAHDRPAAIIRKCRRCRLIHVYYHSVNVRNYHGRIDGFHPFMILHYSSIFSPF